MTLKALSQSLVDSFGNGSQQRVLDSLVGFLRNVEIGSTSSTETFQGLNQVQEISLDESTGSVERTKEQIVHVSQPGRLLKPRLDCHGEPAFDPRQCNKHLQRMFRVPFP